VKGALHEDGVLHVDRAVEALLPDKARAVRLGGVGGEQEKRGVAAQPDHEEDDERYAHDHEHRLGQPPEDVAAHYVTC
jgi:hypothetical protein